MAIDLHGRGIDWHQYEVAPVGMKSRSVVVGIVQRTNYFDWFEVELWEHKPPNCMVLRDRAGSLGLLDIFDKGLQIKDVSTSEE